MVTKKNLWLAKAIEKLAVCSITAIILVALTALLGWLFGMLWNWLVPSLFHGPTLTFYQAWGLWFLIGFIGSAFRNNGGSE